MCASVRDRPRGRCAEHRLARVVPSLRELLAGIAAEAEHLGGRHRRGGSADVGQRPWPRQESNLDLPLRRPRPRGADSPGNPALMRNRRRSHLARIRVLCRRSGWFWPATGARCPNEHSSRYERLARRPGAFLLERGKSPRAAPQRAGDLAKRLRAFCGQGQKTAAVGLASLAWSLDVPGRTYGGRLAATGLGRRGERTQRLTCGLRLPALRRCARGGSWRWMG